MRVEPVVAALVLHDLDDPAPVDFADVFVVEVLVETRIELLVTLVPLRHVLLQSPRVGEDLFAEGALVLEVHFAHCLLVLAEVFVLDLILVLDRLEVDAFAGLA